MFRRVLNKIPKPVGELVKDRVYPDLIAEGEVAPEWHLQAADDTWHRLRSRWSLMVFYPGDDTPGCTAQLQDLQAHAAPLAAVGCDVYAINPAEAPSHRAFAEKHGFTFPLLTDRGGAVARRYRSTVPIPMTVKVIRTVYLVNPERKIRLANRGSPSVAAILRSIQALQQATKAGM